MNIHPKVSAAALAGTITVILMFVLSLFGVTLPAEVSSAITTLLSFLAGYVTPSE